MRPTFTSKGITTPVWAVHSLRNSSWLIVLNDNKKYQLQCVDHYIWFSPYCGACWSPVTCNCWQLIQPKLYPGDWAVLMDQEGNISSAKQKSGKVLWHQLWGITVCYLRSQHSANSLHFSEEHARISLLWRKIPPNSTIPNLFCNRRWKEYLFSLHPLDGFFYWQPTCPMIAPFPMDNVTLK